MISEAEPLNWCVSDRLVEFDDLRDPSKVRDEVQNDDLVLAFAESKAAAELLNKDSPAMRCSHEDDQVNVRDIDAFIEEVDAGHEVQVAHAEAPH